MEKEEAGKEGRMENQKERKKNQLKRVPGQGGQPAPYLNMPVHEGAIAQRRSPDRKKKQKKAIPNEELKK